MHEIDTVLFDLDDTLHDDSAAYRLAIERVTARVAAERGIDARALGRAYGERANAFWHGLTAEHLRTGIVDARESMWDEALRSVGIDDIDLARRCGDAYAAERAAVLALAPGARELLVALRARGVRVGIVTNGFAATHHEKIDLLGLRPLIDGLFLADEVGAVKPDPAFFLHACEALDADPQRTAMVGDRYERDIVGAQSLGMFTVLVDVHAIPLPLDATPPDATVASIGQVLGVLPLAPGSDARAG